MMSDIKKILVPVDGSVNGCKAVDEALSIAEKCGAELDFVYVASNINKDIPSHIVFDRIWEKLPESLTARKHVKSGHVGLLKGVFIGSVSQKVVEESKIPVMVVK